VVVMLTHTADHFTVDRVADALARRGARAFRFDTDRFPSEIRLAARLEGNASRHSAWDRDAALDASEVRAVWTRHIWEPRIADDLDPEFRDACARESSAALHGFLDGLHHARWINDLARAREAENKLLQLRVADGAGFRIPKTLVTNDPRQLRDFFAEMRGSVVAKMLTPLSVSMGKPSRFVYTSEVRAEDVADADSLCHCPMVFQERLAKQSELRIAFVDGRVFAASVDASASLEGQVDWRRASPEECCFRAADVPDVVSAKLVSLMKTLGLLFGAIDLILTPEGEHVFLEVNPFGEWGMLERDAALPISDAIAEALLDRKQRGGAK
ncbi:MAG: MvdC family ATP-grasp ribosomal peptide maturase, partial [Planctomycetes bacterium]|nr:MvdC family ATP-grasp ribosomal peptide maturase [Planctomycetota bacterium]